MVTCTAIQKSYAAAMQVIPYHPAREMARFAIDVSYEIIEDPCLISGDGEGVFGYDPNGRLIHRKKNGQFIDVYK